MTTHSIAGVERGSLGGVVYVEIVFVPLLAMTVEPAFGNRSDEAAAGGEVEVLRIRMLLSRA